MMQRGDDRSTPPSRRRCRAAGLSSRSPARLSSLCAGPLLAANAGQSIGGPLRATAFLAPRRQGGFPVNKTAAAAKVTQDMVGAAYRLTL